MASQLNASVGTAAARCARSIGKGIALIAGFIAVVVLLYEAGQLIGIAWTAWQSVLTDHWTNVWPATWTAWICTLLAACCACMAHKLRRSNTCVWFVAAWAALLLFGVIPANCAAWATTEDWNVEDIPLLDRVAAASASIYVVISLLALVASINWLTHKVAEQTK